MPHNMGMESTETTTTKRAVLTGDTFMVRGALKRHGWNWEPVRKAWTYDSDWSDADQVIRHVRSYAGIRNRGSFAAALEDI